MRDLEFDDALWREAITAFRTEDPVERLRERVSGYGSVVEELIDDAAQGPVLVGFRLVSPGNNPRLLALLTAGFLARSGHDTLLVDLGADVRWLEATLDRDFKEGIVDHLQYGVPIERCLRLTGMERLTVLSGGAYFLAGSPLEDAPGFRATLDRLRGEYRAVVVALPPPVESVDAAGVMPLCDALVTVGEEGAEAPPVGSERAVIRLSGDPRAAGDLARWTRRFIGPLPTLLAASSGSGRAPSATEAGTAATGDRESVLSVDPEGSGSSGTATREPTRRPGSRSGRRVVVGIAAVLALVALGFAGWQLVPGEDARSSVDVEPIRTPVELALGGGTGVPAPGPVADDGEEPASEEPLADDPGEEIDGDSTGAAIDSMPDGAPIPAGRPVPWTAHVGSYLSAESGARLVDRIVETGELAYLAPVDLPGKGRWQRVYVGAYGDSVAAERALGRLIEAGLVEEGVVRSVPMGFRLGVYADRRNAERARDALRNRGVPAYVIGEDPARVWAGAYESRAAAEPLARALAGIETEWTQRRR